MSSKISIFEAMGGTYRTVDGILYPNISAGVEDLLSVSNPDVGKYGLIWISYMKENHVDRYRHHIRMGQLQSKATEVNEEAYEMLDRIMNQFLASHKPKDSNSTMDKWKLREQAKQLAEEVIYGEIVYRYH